MRFCCSWWMAPLCWADNLNHAVNRSARPDNLICRAHDYLLTSGYR